MKKLIIIIAIGVIVLVAGGIFVLKFVTGSNNPKEEQSVVVSLNKEILTNLAKENNMFHYIKVSVSLEVVNDNAARLIEAEMPKIRDEIISVFNGTKVNEFSTPTSIEQVKMRIVQRINLLLKANLVKKVLFTDMVVQ